VKRSGGNHREDTKRRYVDEAPVRAVSGGQQFHNHGRSRFLPSWWYTNYHGHRFRIKVQLLSQDDSNYLQEKGGAIINLRTESTNQFRTYAADQLLQILCVFEATIAVLGNVESIATFYVIKRG